MLWGIDSKGAQSMDDLGRDPTTPRLNQQIGG